MPRPCRAAQAGSMAEKLCRDWVVLKSWTQGVGYSKVVAGLLPLGALAIHARFIGKDWQSFPTASAWLLAWHITAELFFITIIALDRWVPQVRGREWALNAACAVAVALATWLCIVDGQLRADLSIYPAGLAFVAAVMCAPRPIRHPMYAFSLLVLATAVALKANESAAALAALVNPFCVVVLCIELNKFTHARNLELFAQTQRAEAECARADKVFYNAFPASIADELKRDGKVKAVKFENMGVLFADIAGFTSFSRAFPLDALVLVLNDIFSAFDELVERHGLEKIKTNGDALQRYNRVNGAQPGMRIGIHAGSAVAGAIGVKRFLYDVWGNTVNVASRMESTGATGEIQVTEAVHWQIRGQFEFRAREALDIKCGGTLCTWWLLGPVTVAAAP